jgi:hypothetical protein
LLGIVRRSCWLLVVVMLLVMGRLGVVRRNGHRSAVSGSSYIWGVNGSTAAVPVIVPVIVSMIVTVVVVSMVSMSIRWLIVWCQIE